VAALNPRERLRVYNVEGWIFPSNCLWILGFFSKKIKISSAFNTSLLNSHPSSVYDWLKVFTTVPPYKVHPG
jgi:hypothetical protein